MKPLTIGTGADMNWIGSSKFQYKTTEEYNMAQFEKLKENVKENGPGLYDVYYVLEDENGQRFTNCFSIIVNQKSLNNNNEIIPSSLNFYNPGSGMNTDISYLDKYLTKQIENAANASEVPGIDAITLGNGDNTTKTGTLNIHYARGKYDEIKPYSSARNGTAQDMDNVAVHFVSDLSESINNNATPNKVAFSGFSATGNRSFYQALNYLRSEDNKGNSEVYIYCMEPANVKPLSLSTEDIQLLNDSGAKIFDIHTVDYMTINNADYNANSNTHTVNIAHSNQGLHYYEVIAHAYKNENDMLSDHNELKNGSSHGWINQLFSQTGFGDITSSDFDWTSLERNFTTFDVNDSDIENAGMKYFKFEVLEHVPGENGEDQIIPRTLEEMNQIMRYGKITSNSDYAQGCSNIISGSISSSNLTERRYFHPTRSTVNYFRECIDCYSTLINVTNNICEKVQKEFGALVATTNAYDKLDASLARDANNDRGDI